EVFVNDGAKSDTGNIGDILRHDNSVGVTDPIYPVYIDSNVMCGRAGVLEGNGQWSNVTYMPCTAENDFIPEIPDKRIDIVYLCNPSNPTGTAMSKEELTNWVKAAKENNFIIIYDSAYETYITEPDVPHSIFEIEGAKEVAIELRSYSKCAGFTGTRCSYVVVPHACVAYKKDGTAVELNPLWNRRQCTFFNGTPYIVQRAAEAYYSLEGQKQCLADVEYYMENAHIIRDGLTEAGFTVYGATNSPYAWVQTPNGMKSWDFFDLLLEKAHVVTTPGSGFGPHGEGYLRLTAFGTKENTVEAVKRIADLKLFK
uniref:LL-diaminopimelate aminotransferase n=1 Tax=Megasphaera sp. TaxID=2023260 RepID=UPI0025C1E602